MTKPIQWHVGPSKTQISLAICSVWSEIVSNFPGFFNAYLISKPFHESTLQVFFKPVQNHDLHIPHTAKPLLNKADTSDEMSICMEH